MDTPAGSCTFCGQPSDHAHHLTGRHPNGDYLHPDLTTDMCHRHHVLAHNDLRHQNIDTPSNDDWGPVASVTFVLRRLATFVGRFATYADNPLWARFASTLQWCANVLAAHLRTTRTIS